MPQKSGTSMSSGWPGCECTRQHLKIKIRLSWQGRRRSLSCIIQAADARRKAGSRPPAVSAAGHPSPWRIGIARRPGRIGQVTLPGASRPAATKRPTRPASDIPVNARETTPGAFPVDAISSSAYQVDLYADQPLHSLTYLRTESAFGAAAWLPGGQPIRSRSAIAMASSSWPLAGRSRWSLADDGPPWSSTTRNRP
jgi:hypothetical protein